MMPVGYICSKKMKDDSEVINSDITSVSFMIFRTGSMLIVGKCTEPILYEIYDFLCTLFETEYHSIVGKNLDQIDNDSEKSSNKKKNADSSTKTSRKIRKKSIYCNN
jgi:hypothetical protein